METQSMAKDDKPGFCLRVDEPDTGDEYRMGSRGFFIGFANGYRVSVQFGKFNYCSARGEVSRKPFPKAQYEAWLQENCPDAEVAIWNPQGNLVPFKTSENSIPDDVRPYTDPETLVKILEWAASQPPMPPASAPTN